MKHISFLWLTPFLLLVTSATKIDPKVPSIIPNQTDPKVPAINPNQTNPNVPKVPAIISNNTNPNVPKVPAIIPNNTNPNVPAIIPNQTNPNVPEVPAIIPNQTSPNVPKVPAFIPNQTNPNVPKVPAIIPNQTNPNVPKVPSIIPNQTNPNVPKVPAIIPDPKVPAIIVFGDASVDSGNNNKILTLLKSNFLPYGRDFPGQKPTGRFSNGRIFSDFISEDLGLKQTVPAYLDPTYNISDFATGVSFASAGTGYDDLTSHLLFAIPLWKQVEYYKGYQNKLRHYLGDKKANYILREALYLVSLGTDDFLANYYRLLHRRLEYTIDEYQDFLIGNAKKLVQELYGHGAIKVSLVGLPPIGCLPLERTRNILGGHACIENFNKIALKFNSKLGNMAQHLNQELPGIKIVLSNVYSIFQQLIEEPSKHGFEVEAVACCGTGRFETGYLCKFGLFTCKDANKYVFWDSFHPTEKSNEIVAEYVLPKLKEEFL